MPHALDSLIDLDAHPIGDETYQAQRRAAFDTTGVLCLDGFLKQDALAQMVAEAQACQMLKQGQRPCYRSKMQKG